MSVDISAHDLSLTSLAANEVSDYVALTPLAS